MKKRKVEKPDPYEAARWFKYSIDRCFQIKTISEYELSMLYAMCEELLSLRARKGKV